MLSLQQGRGYVAEGASRRLDGENGAVLLHVPGWSFCARLAARLPALAHQSSQTPCWWAGKVTHVRCDDSAQGAILFGSSRVMESGGCWAGSARHDLGCLSWVLVYMCASLYPVLKLPFMPPLWRIAPERAAPYPGNVGLPGRLAYHCFKPPPACLQEEHAIEARR